MKFRLTVLIVFSLCLSNVFADEGMWLLGNLRKNKQTDRVMKELGLQMPVNKIYDPKKPCLADAVVSFGGFCSGVVVSEDGLVFTNHHCGFSSIQQHSSVEHDYLKDGFFARSLEEELPNPELYVRFLLRTEDVTKRVLSAARHAKTETERRVAVDSIMNVISMEVSEKDSTLTGIVDAYYAGNEFWLSVYRDYNDVRLVFAPPSSVGKFGLSSTAYPTTRSRFKRRARMSTSTVYSRLRVGTASPPSSRWCRAILQNASKPGCPNICPRNFRRCSLPKRRSTVSMWFTAYSTTPKNPRYSTRLKPR